MKKQLSVFCMIATALCLIPVAIVSAQSPGIYEAINNSNIRSAPSANSQIIGFLQKNSQIQVIAGARDGSWYQVQLEGGVSGYVHASLLEPIIISSESTTSSSPSTNTSNDTNQESTVAAATSETNQSSTSVELSEAPEDAFLYIISPPNGATLVDGKIWIRFGLRNMGIAPAGINKQYTGHHHLLIDTGIPPLDQPIPNDDNHVHFGRGQTEYFLELSSGQHTLQLLLGDHDHVPHNPPVMSNIITVFVP